MASNSNKKSNKPLTAYQKAIKEGPKGRKEAMAKGAIKWDSPKGRAIAAKAKKDSEKWQRSNWNVASRVADELLLSLTSGRELKKVLRGKASKKDYGNIAGNLASWMVPAGKINKGVNAIVGGNTVRAAVKAGKTANKGKKVVKTTKAVTGAVTKKTVRGTAKTAGVVGAASANESVARKTVEKIGGSAKKVRKKK